MAGRVRLSGQREGGARGALLAPNPKSAAPGHDAHRSSELHSAMAFQHQGYGVTSRKRPRRSPAGLELWKTAASPRTTITSARSNPSRPAQRKTNKASPR